MVDTWINWVNGNGVNIPNGGSTPATSVMVDFQGTVAGMGTHIELKVDSGPYTPVASPVTIQSLPAGQHTINLRSVDALGNVDPTPATWTFTVTAPAAINISLSANPMAAIINKIVTMTLAFKDGQNNPIVNYTARLAPILDGVQKAVITTKVTPATGIVSFIYTFKALGTFNFAVKEVNSGVTSNTLSINVSSGGVLPPPLPPPPPSPTDFNIGVGGDHGTSSRIDTSVALIASKNPELFLGLGDYSYGGSVATWMSKITPIKSVFKPAMGNHEIADDTQADRDYMAATFGVPNSNWIYSFNYQSVHCLMLNTEQSASSQTAFINSDLAAARANPAIKWILVCFHRQIYTAPTHHSADTSRRAAWHPLFDTYKVDLVLQAHNHHYQRSYPMSYNASSPDNPIVRSTNPNSYTKGAAPIFMCVGTMGEQLYSISSKPAWQAVQNATYWGVLDIEFLNSGQTLRATQYRHGGAILDQFTITSAGPASFAASTYPQNYDRISLSF